MVNASPFTNIFFLLIPAGKAKINATDRKMIKSNGNLPIPHSEKAKANVVNCILIFLRQSEFIWDYYILPIDLAKIIDVALGKPFDILNSFSAIEEKPILLNKFFIGQ